MAHYETPRHHPESRNVKKIPAIIAGKRRAFSTTFLVTPAKPSEIRGFLGWEIAEVWKLGQSSHRLLLDLKMFVLKQDLRFLVRVIRLHP